MKLKLKFELGLFQNPVTNYEDYIDFGSKKHQKLAYKSASESITLLKNSDNILPLKGKPSILVVGPNGNNMRTLNGAWTYSWQGEKTEKFAQKHNTIYESISNIYGKKNVKFVSGVEYPFNADFDKDPKFQYYDQNEKNFNN